MFFVGLLLPHAFAAHVRFLKPETPGAMAQIIRAAVTHEYDQIFFEPDRLQIRGPLAIDLPALRPSRRGLFLRDLKRVLAGERVSEDELPLHTTNAVITVRDAAGAKIDLARLEFPDYVIQPVPDAKALVDQVFTGVPTSHVNYDSTSNKLKLTGTWLIQLGQFEATQRRAYRSHLDVIFDGERTYLTFDVDAGDAAIVHLPEVTALATTPGIIHHAWRIRRRPEWTTWDIAYHNVRDLERWLKRFYISDRPLLLELDDAVVESAAREEFRGELRARLGQGRLPDGLLLPPHLIRVIPAGLSTIVALACRNLLGPP